MASFDTDQSLTQLQNFIGHVYGLTDDRLFSLWDLLTQVQRFAMRALKGIRKDNRDKLKLNLLISFSWLLAVANRLHINLEDELWARFPTRCPYCAKAPCQCQKVKSAPVKPRERPGAKRPKTLAAFQTMFRSIYPPERRTLPDAGVHLAEETGEVSEAIHNFLGEHLPVQFDDVTLEMADWVSCVFGVANSAGLDLALELSRHYHNNCHICHAMPCRCTFNQVASYKT